MSVQRVPRGRPEASVLDAVFIAVGCAPDFRVWRNSTGVSRADGRFIRYGLCVGSADLVGILRMPDGVGRFVSIECKSATGRLTDDQTKWAAVIRAFGGFACTVRSGEEALAALDRARKGASE